MSISLLNAPLLEKSRHLIGLTTVVQCSGLDHRRHPQSRALPFQTAANRPGQNSAQLPLQFVPKPGVAALAGELLFERDEVNPPPDGVVGTMNLGKVIGGKPDFELRRVVEVFLIKVSGRNGIASGHLLNRGLVERGLLLRFCGFDQTSSMKLCHVVTRRTRILMNQER